MIRDSFRRFGCGMNWAINGAALKYCEANALDFFIYRNACADYEACITFCIFRNM